jgi:glycosyltransferase involved in cell wall biosynthesis
MPTLNGAKYIASALSSLVAQNDRESECVVVDQGSTDDTLSLIERYSDKLDLSVISAPQNKSWMENVNLGLEHARGEFVSILHQDDVWHAGRTEQMTRLIRRVPHAKLYFHPVEFIDHHGRRLGRWSCPFSRDRELVPSQEILKSLLVQNFISVPAPMFRRQDALALGGLDTDLWYTADWDFYLKLVRLGPAAYLPEVLAGFRIHPTSLTITGSRNAAEFAKQLSVPVSRHIEALDDPATRRKVRKLAAFSNTLNLFLAKRFHRHDERFMPIVGKFLALGPQAWVRYFRYSRLHERVYARLRLRRTADNG